MRLKQKIFLGVAAVLMVAGIAVYLGMQIRVEGGPPQLGGEVLERQITHAGLERSYLVYKPSREVRHAPVLFVLHGSQGTAEAMRKITGYQFDRLADEEGILIVYPQGYEKHWNDCRGSADYTANVENVDDIGFFLAMIDALQPEFGIDAGEVIITGASNGGQMAYKLALERPGAIKAAVPVVANLPVAENLDCSESGQAVNIAIINGTSDPVNPYGGGIVSILGNTSRGEVRSATDSAAYFARLAGYEGGPVVTELADLDPSDDGRPILHQWSGRQYQVRLYEMTGMGHNVPSRKVRFGWLLDWLMGGANRDLEWADETWAFYQEVSGSLWERTLSAIPAPGLRTTAPFPNHLRSCSDPDSQTGMIPPCS